METEELLQAAKEIKEICDNVNGCCGKCPFSYPIGNGSLTMWARCKFSDRLGYRREPSSWNLDGN